MPSVIAQQVVSRLTRAAIFLADETLFSVKSRLAVSYGRCEGASACHPPSVEGQWGTSDRVEGFVAWRAKRRGRLHDIPHNIVWLRVEDGGRSCSDR